MSSDFWSKIDSTIEEQRAKQARDETAMDQGEQFAIEAATAAAGLAETYRAELASRGITAKVEHGSTSLAFRLKYADGGHHDLLMALERPRSRMKLTTYFSDQGKNYTADGGTGWTAASWTVAAYEQQLQRHINEYMTYAERHHGTA